MKKVILLFVFAAFANISIGQTLEVKDGKVQRKRTHPDNGIVFYESATPDEIQGQIDATDAAIGNLKKDKTAASKTALKDLQGYISVLKKEITDSKKLDATIPKPIENADIIQK